MATNSTATKNTSICRKCSAYTYCVNKDKGMMACINYNVFPKPSDDEISESRNTRAKRV